MSVEPLIEGREAEEDKIKLTRILSNVARTLRGKGRKIFLSEDRGSQRSRLPRRSFPFSPSFASSSRTLPPFVFFSPTTSTSDFPCCPPPDTLQPPQLHLPPSLGLLLQLLLLFLPRKTGAGSLLVLLSSTSIRPLSSSSISRGSSR